MSANYPAANPSFTPIVDGVDYPQAVDINSLQDEVTAIGTALVTSGIAHDLAPDATASTRDLGTTSRRWDRLYATNLSARGVDYVWPSADGTSGQALTTDGAATLSWTTIAPTTNPVRVLDRAVAVATVASTAAETTVYTYAVAGGTLGSTKALRLSLIGDYLNNDANPRGISFKVKYGATTILTAVESSNLSANRGAVTLTVLLSALNATNAQCARGVLSFAEGSENNAGGTMKALSSTHRQWVGTHATVAEDSTASKNLVVTVQHDSSSANLSFRCHAVQVELLD